MTVGQMPVGLMVIQHYDSCKNDIRTNEKESNDNRTIETRTTYSWANAHQKTFGLDAN